MAQLYLIGTNHDDNKGPRRLGNALKAEQPEILTLELPIGYSIANEDTYLEIVCEMFSKSGVKPELINRYARRTKRMDLFEVKSCLSYAKESKIPLYCVDDERLYSSRDNKYDKLLNYFLEQANPKANKKDLEDRINKLLELSSKKGQVKADFTYRAFGSIFDKETQSKKTLRFLKQAIFINGSNYKENKVLLGYLEQEAIKEFVTKRVMRRDETMAKRIAELARNNPDSKIVHVGGLAHLLEDGKGKTLYSRLKEEFNPTRKTLLDYD